MAAWRLLLLLLCGVAGRALAGSGTEEELAHYVKKAASTDHPLTSKERWVHNMIEEEIVKFNMAPETTECPLDSHGKPKPTEGREPVWWNQYRQEKYGDMPDWSADIKQLIKEGGRTPKPWTPSQESEEVLPKWRNMEPFTWRPGAKIITLRVKTDATTRASGPTEPTTERSYEPLSVQWDTSEDDGDVGGGGAGAGGGGGTEPPLNLASLQKGYHQEEEYLLVKSRKRCQEGFKKRKAESHLYLHKQGNDAAKKMVDVNEIEGKQKTDQLRRSREKRRRSCFANLHFVGL